MAASAKIAIALKLAHKTKLVPTTKGFVAQGSVIQCSPPFPHDQMEERERGQLVRGGADLVPHGVRLAVHGALRVDGAQSDVSGTAWMDREWSTSALSAGVVGWEWFGVQLSDDRELMLYRLLQTDGKSGAS